MVFEVKKAYSWRNGYSPSISADIVGQVISDIEEKDGYVTKESFLDASRPSDSPTHNLFEWDDAIAGEKYRLSVSGRIITQLDVQIVTEEQEIKQFVPAFLNNRRDREGAQYRNIVTTLCKTDTREIVIDRLRRDIDALVEKYKIVEELADILQEKVDELKNN